MRTLILGLAMMALTSGCVAFAQHCAEAGGQWDGWQGKCSLPYQGSGGGNPGAALATYMMLPGMNQPTYTPMYQPRSLAPALNCQSFGVGTAIQTTCY